LEHVWVEAQLSGYHCCVSGSGRIQILLPDPDRDQHPGHADHYPAHPDRYQFKSTGNEKVDQLNFFPENFNIVTKIQKILIHLSLTLMRKIKHCKLTIPSLKAFYFYFSTSVKLEYGSA
jgi:hypothetical protein